MHLVQDKVKIVFLMISIWKQVFMGQHFEKIIQKISNVLFPSKRTQGARLARPRLPFLKSKKTAQILGKNTLVVSIYGVNVSLEMQFLEHLGEKTSGPLVCYKWNVYRSAFIARNLAFPEKFLVAHMASYLCRVSKKSVTSVECHVMVFFFSVDSKHTTCQL